jgi:hypothetical protein
MSNVVRALSVVVFDPKIRAYLLKESPQTLKQAVKALADDPAAAALWRAGEYTPSLGDIGREVDLRLKKGPGQ